MNAATQLEPAFQLYRELVLADQVLAREFDSSTADLFGGQVPGAPGSTEAALSERRYLEWFVLERHSPALFGVPVERWLDRARERATEAGADLQQGLDALIESFTGIFVVTEVRAGQGVWLQDLAGFGEYALSEPEGARFLESGDLIVGRLFPVGEGLHQASPAAGVFRNPDLVTALRKDLDAARAMRAAKVLHVSQHELEPMFFSGPDLATVGSDHIPGSEALQGDLSVADPVGEARLYLASAGLAESAIDEMMSTLAAAPFDAERLVHGARDTLGDILDSLAFETKVDLVHARSLLQQAWARISKKRETPRAEVPAGDPRSAVEAFVQGRTRGEDVDRLITDLERDLALEPGDEPDEDELAPAPDFPGVVGAMVDEFLWEVGRESGAEAVQRLRSLQLLASFAQPIGVFEELGAAELLRFTTFWIHEREALASADETVELLDALEAFCTWTGAEHEMPLAADFAPTLERLRASLPRIVRANRELVTPAQDDSGELFELHGGSEASAYLIDREGAERSVKNVARLLAWLQEHDRLRGRIDAAGDLRVYRCYPPEAAQLLV